MSVENRPVSIAILSFPETTASVVYGLYDLFASTGRDWGSIVDGTPGPSLVKAFIVSKTAGGFRPQTESSSNRTRRSTTFRRSTSSSCPR